MFKDTLEQDYPLIFSNAVVLLDKVPYFVVGFNGSNGECLNIGTQDYKMIDFKKVKEISIPNIGYFNHRGVCAFLYRLPVRRFKHGVSKENTNYIISPQLYDDIARNKITDASELIRRLTSKSHYNMYMNIYPSLQDALELLQDGGYCIAFDRQFAIDIHGVIWYKCGKVGTYDAVNKRILLPKHEYLRIALPKELQ